MTLEPEARHCVCWYSRRTGTVVPDLSVQTIIDGELLYCAHPMWFPVVGYRFDVRNCAACELFKATKGRSTDAAQGN